MEEGAVGEEAGASAVDSDDSLPQPTPIPLVETMDEALPPDMLTGTPGTSSVFQSAWVPPYTPPYTPPFTPLPNTDSSFKGLVCRLHALMPLTNVLCEVYLI